MDYNLSNDCYEFIEQNKLFFDLKKYDIDHAINIDKINEYISHQTCSIEFFNFIKKLLESVKYISCDEIIQILNKNIEEICNFIDNKEIKYIPILITTDSILTKSNVYFTLYFLYNLNIKSKKIDYIYKDIKDILINPEQWIKHNIINYETYNSPQFLFIICDDITYSGNQISTNFQPKLSYGKNKFDIPSNFYIYFNFIAFLPQAITKINSVIESKNLIIPQNSILIKDDDSCSSVNQFIKNNNINTKLYDSYIIKKNNNKYILESQINNYLYNTKASLVYPFYKYPDHVSTFTNICFVKNMNSDIYVLNIDNFNKYFNIDNDKFILHFDYNLEIFINNIINDHNQVQNIISLINNFWNQNISDINWIDKCNNITSNDYIQFINNGNYTQFNKNNDPAHYNIYNDTTKCYNIIKSFYKNLNYTFLNIKIEKYDNLSDIIEKYNNLSNNYYNKYIKYKNKYIKYKNNKKL